MAARGGGGVEGVDRRWNTSGSAARGKSRDSLAQTFEVRVQVLAISALDGCVWDALAFAAAVGGCGGWFGGLVGLGGDEVIVAFVAAGGFDGWGRLVGFDVLAFDWISFRAAWHRWTIDAHGIGDLLVRTD